MLKRAIIVSAARAAMLPAAPAGGADYHAAPAPGRNVRVLATGGTIAGTGKGSSTSYQAGVVPVGDILRAVPGLANIANIAAEQVANVPSGEMNATLWLRLFGRARSALSDAAVSGVVVTHGTDTLEETAYFLSLVLPSTKPVVIVGSMRPGTAASPDGPQNLLDAVRVASADQARDRGVVVVMNDTIFDPASVTKLDIHRVNAFAAPTRGPIGDVLTDTPRFFEKAAPHDAEFAVVTQQLPRVAVVCAYAGLRAEDIRSASRGAKGLIFAGVGAGGFSTDAGRALKELTSRGIAVVRTARQGAGDVWREDDPEYEGSDHQLGTIAGRELTPAKARICSCSHCRSRAPPPSCNPYSTAMVLAGASSATCFTRNVRFPPIADIRKGPP